jgi:hypothetical protein
METRRRANGSLSFLFSKSHLIIILSEYWVNRLAKMFFSILLASLFDHEYHHHPICKPRSTSPSHSTSRVMTRIVKSISQWMDQIHRLARQTNMKVRPIIQQHLASSIKYVCQKTQGSKFQIFCIEFRKCDCDDSWTIDTQGDVLRGWLRRSISDSNRYMYVLSNSL